MKKRKLAVVGICVVLTTLAARAEPEGSRERTARFLAALQGFSVDMQTVLTDIVQIQAQRCRHTVTVEDLKALSANDEHYFSLLRAVMTDKTYPQSEDYRQRMNRHFGECR